MATRATGASGAGAFGTGASDAGASGAAASRTDPAESLFRTRVLEIVSDIPAGRVMTYGDVAAVSGSSAARAVGRVMAESEGMPWWRVVRASGHPASGHEEEALERLAAEGTPMSTRQGRVDLAAARHRP